MAKILITESVHPIGPELLTAALRAHLPACAPDFARVMRLEVLDAAGEPFR